VRYYGGAMQPEIIADFYYVYAGRFIRLNDANLLKTKKLRTKTLPAAGIVKKLGKARKNLDFQGYSCYSRDVKIRS
jgi:hypothetical protein